MTGSAKDRQQHESVALADGLRPVILRVARELRREARAVGVSPGQVTLLASIKHSPGIGVNELAERERMTPPGMSAHVNKLVRAGYIRKLRDDEDRRRVGLVLTPEGTRLLRNVRSRRTVWLARQLGTLTVAERSALAAAIEPLGLLLDEDQRA